jgi:hypothetical protein
LRYVIITSHLYYHYSSISCIRFYYSIYLYPFRLSLNAGILVFINIKEDPYNQSTKYIKLKYKSINNYYNGPQLKEKSIPKINALFVYKPKLILLHNVNINFMSIASSNGKKDSKYIVHIVKIKISPI